MLKDPRLQQMMALLEETLGSQALVGLDVKDILALLEQAEREGIALDQLLTRDMDTFINRRPYQAQQAVRALEWTAFLYVMMLSQQQNNQMNMMRLNQMAERLAQTLGVDVKTFQTQFQKNLPELRRTLDTSMRALRTVDRQQFNQQARQMARLIRARRSRAIQLQQQRNETLRLRRGRRPVQAVVENEVARPKTAAELLRVEMQQDAVLQTVKKNNAEITPVENIRVNDLPARNENLLRTLETKIQEAPTRPQAVERNPLMERPALQAENNVIPLAPLTATRETLPLTLSMDNSRNSIAQNITRQLEGLPNPPGPSTTVRPLDIPKDQDRPPIGALPPRDILRDAPPRQLPDIAPQPPLPPRDPAPPILPDLKPPVQPPRLYDPPKPPDLGAPPPAPPEKPPIPHNGGPTVPVTPTGLGEGIGPTGGTGQRPPIRQQYVPEGSPWRGPEGTPVTFTPSSPERVLPSKPAHISAQLHVVSADEIARETAKETARVKAEEERNKPRVIPEGVEPPRKPVAFSEEAVKIINIGPEKPADHKCTGHPCPICNPFLANRTYTPPSKPAAARDYDPFNDIGAAAARPKQTGPCGNCTRGTCAGCSTALGIDDNKGKFTEPQEKNMSSVGIGRSNKGR
ncbi:MAG: hypothetical protein AB7G80_09825 [Dongiaceae bacterium]